MFLSRLRQLKRLLLFNIIVEQYGNGDRFYGVKDGWWDIFDCWGERAGEDGGGEVRI